MKIMRYKGIGLTIFILSLLVALPLSAKNSHSNGRQGLPPQASANGVGNGVELSDLNGDRRVDLDDLGLFAESYLSSSWEDVEWCHFHEAASINEQFFQKRTRAATKRFVRLLKFIEREFDCPKVPRSVDKSDLSGDNEVNLDDLSLFSTNYQQTYWETVDWCEFHASTLAGDNFNGRRTRYYLMHFRRMLLFINDEFNCGGSEPPQTDVLVVNTPDYFVRMAVDGNKLYVTDAMVGSVFVLDENLVPQAEIKGLSRPIGLALDREGNVLVGNDGRDNVEVYDPATGALLAVIGDGDLLMPTSITVDELGNIYVTDGRRHVISVFDPYYNPVRTIGSPGEADTELMYPVDTAVSVATNEVFVADRGNRRLQVYDLEGNWTRTIYHSGRCGWFRCTSPPFRKIQAIEFDSLGRLHVLDNFTASVMVFDPVDGTFIDPYGSYGQGPGFLRVPQDLAIDAAGVSLITSGDGSRIELMEVPW